MKKCSAFVAIIFCSILAAGCNKDPVIEKVRDVDYFKKNQGELKAVRDKCRANPGQLEDTPECINADRATVILDAERGSKK